MAEPWRVFRAVLEIPYFSHQSYSSRSLVIWETVLPPPGRKIGGAGTLFQARMSADCMYRTGHSLQKPPIASDNPLRPMPILRDIVIPPPGAPISFPYARFHSTAAAGGTKVKNKPRMPSV
jgi:hypothetical protein